MVRDLVESQKTRDASAASPGGHETVLVESPAVLIRSPRDLFQSARDPGTSAKALGKTHENLVLFAAVPGRQEKALFRLQEVPVALAGAGGRRERVLVDSPASRFSSAEDPGESPDDENQQEKERSKKAKAVSQPSTSQEVQLLPNKSVHRSVAVLKLPKVVAHVITFAQSVVTAMTNNPHFPSPTPTRRTARTSSRAPASR